MRSTKQYFEMKNLLISLTIILAMVSCTSKDVKVVEEYFQSGTPKMVIDYKVTMGDSIPLHRTDFHKNGEKRMEGNFVNGKRDGEWMSWYANGVIWSKGYFEKGLRTGKSWAYYPSGKLYLKGSYENGEKVGKWLVFNEDGIVIGEDSF